MNGPSESNGCIEPLHLVKSLIICVSESVVPESDLSGLINIISHLVFLFEFWTSFGKREGCISDEVLFLWSSGYN